MAVITSPAELKLLRASGQILAMAMRTTLAAVRPGVNTAALNAIADAAIRAAGAEPSFLGYQGYPAALCTSVNSEVVHGIPDPQRVLHDGDIVGLDLGVNYQGWFTDHAITVAVGNISAEDQQLIDDSKEAMMFGIRAATVDHRIGHISAAIAGALKPHRYGIIRQLTGHGVGRAIHEEPSIPNFGAATTGPLIVPGMVLAIEPMVARGGWAVVTAEDGWTVRTADGSRAAHFEHTILVTEHGPEILTA